ncbi:hypothetical protein FALCPG4_017106 [Fusarium falciforme]
MGVLGSAVIPITTMTMVMPLKKYLGHRQEGQGSKERVQLLSPIHTIAVRSLREVGLFLANKTTFHAREKC